ERLRTHATSLRQARATLLTHLTHVHLTFSPRHPSLPATLTSLTTHLADLETADALLRNLKVAAAMARYARDLLGIAAVELGGGEGGDAKVVGVREVALTLYTLPTAPPSPPSLPTHRRLAHRLSHLLHAPILPALRAAIESRTAPFDALRERVATLRTRLGGWWVDAFVAVAAEEGKGTGEEEVRVLVGDGAVGSVGVGGDLVLRSLEVC
ncbi:hypothetical protein HDU96_000865, partial [Phlyctochytrium bullatum]